MPKVTLNNIGSGTAFQTAIATINANNDTLETAFENTLSRDGTTPNTMSSNLDMNSNRILNLPFPSSDLEPARLIDVVDGISGTVTVGTTNTLTPGSPATVVNVGTPNAAILNFGIPQGTPGTIQGSVGVTDNRVLRADGTGGTILQNSAVTIDDSGNISGALTVDIGNADTTISRASAGVIAVEGNTVPVNSVSQTATFGTIELGNVSDTTIARSGAGAITVEGVGVALNSTSLPHTASQYEVGNASDTTISRASAGVIAVEGVNLTPNIPINSQSAAYGIVLADANTAIYHPSSDNNARTFTIPANASVAFPVGTCITFINEINTVTVAITTDTLTLMGSGATGSRSLAANGIATAVKVSSTKWVISGTNLT